ncbi:MAG: hypothetical protein LBD11_04800 [Candidatus Peribacteria bacterium]|jgi:hypothetical protein|nr:hypothetical protein [Candidatus Peribacteria bacterium]
MRKFLTSLAILVLSLQTVLPNFLYAQESTLLEGGETLEQNIITEQNEVIEVPSCIEGQILDEDT